MSIVDALRIFKKAAGMQDLSSESSMPVIDMCDQGHKFAKLPDHPMRDGKARCPHCMATGLDAAWKELDEIRNELHQQAIEKDLLD